MVSTPKRILYISLLFPILSHAAFQPEADGLVSMCASSYTSNIAQGGGQWVTATSSVCPSALRLSGGPEHKDDFDGARVDFTINFATAGTYRVWIRCTGPSGSGDSVHVLVNGEAQPLSQDINGCSLTGFDWLSQVFVGTQQDGAYIDVPAGLVTVSVAGREPDTTFDKVVITPDDTYIPPPDGPPESAQDTSPTGKFVIINYDRATKKVDGTDLPLSDIKRTEVYCDGVFKTAENGADGQFRIFFEWGNYLCMARHVNQADEESADSNVVELLVEFEISVAPNPPVITEAFTED